MNVRMGTMIVILNHKYVSILLKLTDVIVVMDTSKVMKRANVNLFVPR